MNRQGPARALSLRCLAPAMLAWALAGCHAGQAEQREPAAAAAPASASIPKAESGVRVVDTPVTPATATLAQPVESPAPARAPARAPAVLPASDPGRRCRTDADCAVKDVGSCCGYRPQCLNKDTPTFPEEVKARCASAARVSTCGMLAVGGCQCVSGQCENRLLSDESLPAAPAPLK